MISNVLELRSACGVSCEKEFLKHNRVNGESNATSCFRRKQLCRRRITAEVSNDHVCVKKHEWPLCVRTFATFEQLGFGHLLHLFYCTTSTVLEPRSPLQRILSPCHIDEKSPNRRTGQQPPLVGPRRPAPGIP